MNFDPDQFDINENYEKEWTKKFNKEKVKYECETRKRNNGNVSYNRKEKFCTNK
jgi:hypothetical protein